jgi:hypothetical protein
VSDELATLASVAVGGVVATGSWFLGYVQGWTRGYTYGTNDELRRAARRARYNRRAPSEGEIGFRAGPSGFDSRRLHDEGSVE